MGFLWLCNYIVAINNGNKSHNSFTLLRNMPQQEFNLQKTFSVLYHFSMQDGSACVVDLSLDIYSVTLYE